MVQVKDIESAVGECERFIQRAKNWTKTYNNTMDDQCDRHVTSSLIRSSMDASEALTKLRGGRNR